jgi:hypothetical protein
LKFRPQPSSDRFSALLWSQSCRRLHPGAILLRLPSFHSNQMPTFLMLATNVMVVWTLFAYLRAHTQF